jgi:hypothetical protein
VNATFNMCRSAALAIASLAFCACASKPAVIPAKPGPVPAQCEPECRQPCTVSLTWAPADADSSDAWGSLVTDVIVPLRAQVDECNSSRQSCVRCLDRLRASGVIR